MPYVVPPEKIAFYKAHGWVVLEDVVSPAEVARIRGVLNDILEGRLDAGKNRADLGGFLEQVRPGTENIVQIAWPTDITSALDENEFIQSSRVISDSLYGDASGTWSLDMNQFLVKQPQTKTDTPWHQDQSYYVDLPDQRACNLWLALGDVSEDMGCLWFENSPLAAPEPLRPHWPAGRGGGALQAEGFLERATAAPLRAGSITVHSHLTPHYARGNSTGVPRMGYVVQTRPAASVRAARMLGFDHGRCAGNKPRAALAAPPPSRFKVDALAQPLAAGARPRTWGLSMNALAQAHAELGPAYTPWAAAAAAAMAPAGACYFYHHDFTHVTAAAPAPFTHAALAGWTEAERSDFTARWRDALRDSIAAAGSEWPRAPFPLTFGKLELHDSCAMRVSGRAPCSHSHAHPHAPFRAHTHTHLLHHPLRAASKSKTPRAASRRCGACLWGRQRTRGSQTAARARRCSRARASKRPKSCTLQ